MEPIKIMQNRFLNASLNQLHSWVYNLKRNLKKEGTMFNVSLSKGSSMFLELCYSLSDISDAFQPSMR